MADTKSAESVASLVERLAVIARYLKGADVAVITPPKGPRTDVQETLREAASRLSSPDEELLAWKDDALISLAKWHALGDELQRIYPLNVGDDIPTALLRKVRERLSSPEGTRGDRERCIGCGHAPHRRHRCDVSLGLDNRGNDAMCACLEDSLSSPSSAPAVVCGEMTPDRTGRACDKPKGHDGDHWTYGGNTLTWASSAPAATPADTRCESTQEFDGRDVRCDLPKGHTENHKSDRAESHGGWFMWPDASPRVSAATPAPAATPAKDERPMPPWTHTDVMGDLIQASPRVSAATPARCEATYRGPAGIVERCSLPLGHEQNHVLVLAATPAKYDRLQIYNNSDCTVNVRDEGGGLLSVVVSAAERPALTCATCKHWDRKSVPSHSGKRFCLVDRP